MEETEDMRVPRSWTRPVCIAAAVVALAGCLSVAEGSYYTLDMRDSENVETAFQVEVGRFATSDALSRPELLIQATPTRIEYYAVDQWASDLAEMVQEKLQVEFGPAEMPTYRIEGDIVAFEQVDVENGADAHVRMRVRGYDAAQRRSSDPVLRKTYDEVVPAAEPTPEEVVAALSHALERIAVQIANDLSTL